jgi:hypothetical protein
VSDEAELEDEVRFEGASLSERMQAAADQLEKQTTEVFDLPRFFGVLAVELRALGYKAVRKVQQRNGKVRDDATRELYNMADQIILATEQFLEVTGDNQTPISDTWVDLARRMPDCPEAPTPRQALLFLLEGDKRLHLLFGEWVSWMATVRTDIDGEVERDFAKTE